MQKIITLELPDGTGDEVIMAGGVVLERQSFRFRVPDARMFVDVWQGTAADGTLYQAWRWMMYYD